MNVIKANGSYRLITFSNQFLVVDFSNKEVGIVVKHIYFRRTSDKRIWSIMG